MPQPKYPLVALVVGAAFVGNMNEFLTYLDVEITPSRRREMWARLSNHDIDVSHWSRSPRGTYSNDELRVAVAASDSYAEVMRRLGIKPAGGSPREPALPVPELPRADRDLVSANAPGAVASTAQWGARGGTGLHSNFRGCRLRAWGFESPRAHVVELEQMAVEVQVRFDARPDVVFALLHDVERMAGLGPEHESATWTSATTFTGRNRIEDLGLNWEVSCWVVDDRPPTSFAWTVGPPDSPSATWRYSLGPDGDGTVVTQRMEHGPGETYLRIFCEQRPDKAERAIARRSEELRQNMTTVLEAAAELLRQG